MKKILVSLVLMFALLLPISALSAPVEIYGTLHDFVTMVSTTVAGTTGQVFHLAEPSAAFTCSSLWSGNAAAMTNAVTKLQVSSDGINFVDSITSTATTTYAIYQSVPRTADYPTVTFIRGVYVSKSGGDATTTVTLTCIPSH